MAESMLEKETAPRRLLFWLLFIGGHVAIFIWGFFAQKNDHELDNLNVVGFSIWMSRGAGIALGLDCAIILLPMLRNVVKLLRMTFLNRIIPFDENIWFHRQVAYSMLIFTLIHTFAHYINFWKIEVLFAGSPTPRPAWTIHYNTWAGLTGHIMLIIMMLMYTSAHQKIRNQSFETFWYTHHLSFFFLLAVYNHANGCFVRTAANVCKGYLTWRFTIWGGIAYFFERVVREVRARQPTHLHKVVAHPAKAIELQFKKPSFKYRAGQYLFVNIPEVSAFEWHPFTITSAPNDPYISIHIRQVGDWTTKLGDILGCNRKDIGDTEQAIALTASQMPTLRIDGPFGAPAEDVFENEIAVLVGCGIGVTPFAAILKNIWYQHKNRRPSKLRRVEFFWICRDTGSFAWFQSLIKTLEATQMDENFLKIHIYLTSKLRHSTIQNIVINDVSSNYDPLTDLSSRTHYGRPNFAYVFEQMKTAIESGTYLPGKERELTTKVGVYYCGPSALAQSLKVECKQANTPGVKFGFYKEHF